MDVQSCVKWIPIFFSNILENYKKSLKVMESHAFSIIFFCGNPVIPLSYSYALDNPNPSPLFLPFIKGGIIFFKNGCNGGNGKTLLESLFSVNKLRKKHFLIENCCYTFLYKKQIVLAPWDSMLLIFSFSLKYTLFLKKNNFS